jgi:hypothetical protein
MLQRVGIETDDAQLRIEIIEAVGRNYRFYRGGDTLQWMLELGEHNEEPKLRLAAAQGIFQVVAERWNQYARRPGLYPFAADLPGLFTVIEWLHDVASQDPDPPVKHRALRLLRQFATLLDRYNLDADSDFSELFIKLQNFLSSHPSADDAQGSE